MSLQAIGLTIRQARQRVILQVAAVVVLGGYFAIAGPALLAPVCWAVATVMYWRRGVVILNSLRDVPAASPIIDVVYPPEAEIATAIARPARKSSE